MTLCAGGRPQEWLPGFSFGLMTRSETSDDTDDVEDESPHGQERRMSPRGCQRVGPRPPSRVQEVRRACWVAAASVGVACCALAPEAASQGETLVMGNGGVPIADEHWSVVGR